MRGTLDLSSNLLICSEALVHSASEITVAVSGRFFGLSELSNPAALFCEQYRTKGLAACREFNFEAVILIHDQKKKLGLLIRDRMGCRQIYYSLEQGVLSFSENPCDVSILAGKPALPNLNAVQSFLRYSYLPGTQTFWTGVQSLPAGNCLELNLKSLKIDKYHTWKAEVFRGSFAEAKKALLALILDALNLRCGKDLNLLLSGGIDSSSLAVAGKKLGRNLTAYTITFDEPDYNEIQSAEAVARYLGIKHEKIHLTFEMFKHWMVKLLSEKAFLLRSQGQLSFIAALSGRHSSFVNGAGSDEGLLGYDYQLSALAKRERQSRYYSLFPVEMLDNLPRNTILKDIFNDELQEIFDHREYLTPYFNSDELKEMFQKGWTEPEHFWIEWMKPMNSLTDFQYDELLPDNQLPRIRGIADAAESEILVPFADYRFRNFFQSLPDDFRLNGKKSKFILHELMRNDLPEQVLTRPKTPLKVPIDRWFEKGRPFFCKMLSEFSASNGVKIEPQRLFEDTRNLGYKGFEKILLLLSGMACLKNNSAPEIQGAFLNNR
ncbi:MAG: asparagine synthase-related protein [Candidatus Wallbacteria bacterium]|nr:asparagine synthase-related protein [Candidatus Wallbacteria bacterium]